MTNSSASSCQDPDLHKVHSSLIESESGSPHTSPFCTLSCELFAQHPQYSRRVCGEINALSMISEWRRVKGLRWPTLGLNIRGNPFSDRGKSSPEVPLFQNTFIFYFIFFARLTPYHKSPTH